MDITSDKKDAQMADVLEILKLSRKMIVGLDLLKNLNIPEEFKKQTEGAVEKLHDISGKYIGKC